ncbi:MAG: response regulator [Chloroflexi bacterium]|nr:response regulator [Chloroflexota bacterium]
MKSDESDREAYPFSSRLSDTSLQINKSLDFDVVLQEVLDSARSVTGARYGVIAILDGSGQLKDVLCSGMTSEEEQQLRDLPNGMLLFEYFSKPEELLRLGDLLGHMRSQGLPDLDPPLEVPPLVSFQSAPIIHMGERLGNIFVGAKETGGEFSSEDEDTLAMLASHAGTAIANARLFRDEQRAKTDLETLIDTSPVGVAVFDARTGAPISLNRELLRIVEGLRNPDQPPEQLLEVMLVRRADGREFPLAEFPFARVLSLGETVHAEEITMQVPDGRSVTALGNATPIRSQEGEVESFVVTLQDMSSVEELDRLRAEFLGMVSHELRVPLTAIKGSATTLLEEGTALDPAEMRQFFRIIVQQTDHMRGLIGNLLDVARIHTGTLPVDSEPVDAVALVDRARSVFLDGGGRHDLDIDVDPDLPLVMADRRRIVQVLGNLLSNAARHSSESSVIRVTAVLRGIHVEISVADEGRGIPADDLPHLFTKFSRIGSGEQGSEIGGAGLGLAICKGIVEAHGGRIHAESDGPGLGARFTFTVPVAENPAPESARPSTPYRKEKKKRTRVLVVDDDPQTLRYVRDALSEAGYTPIVTGDSDEALVLVKEERPQLVILDLLLADSNGIDLMEDIFDVADVPIIFLSVYGRDEVIARAFESGAADYIVKPFSPMELVARVKAALSRWNGGYGIESFEPYVHGDLIINYAERAVTVAGNPVQLTPREYDLLVELSANAGRVVKHGDLLHRVWNPKKPGNIHALRSQLRRLRRKLGDDASDPTYIFVQPRVGYRMPKPEQEE